MGKRKSPMFQKLSNLIKISIFIAKMRLVYLKKSTKFNRFKGLKRYNSYGYIQERQFSPSSSPLVRFRRPKLNGSWVYSIHLLSCFGGPRHVNDENYSFESAIVEVERDGFLELSYGYGDAEEDEDSVDERAERFIERFYDEMKRQRRESSSSLANLPLNRMLEY